MVWNGYDQSSGVPFESSIVFNFVYKFWAEEITYFFLFRGRVIWDCSDYRYIDPYDQPRTLDPTYDNNAQLSMKGRPTAVFFNDRWIIYDAPRPTVLSLWSSGILGMLFSKLDRSVSRRPPLNTPRTWTEQKDKLIRSIIDAMVSEQNELYDSVEFIL